MMPKNCVSEQQSKTIPAVSVRFKHKDISERVLAACRYQSKTLEQLALSLGLNRESGYAAALEFEMDRLIEKRSLPITKDVQQHIDTAGRARKRTVKYALTRETRSKVRSEPVIRVWIDPSLKGTWDGTTTEDLSARKKEAWAESAALREAVGQQERAQMRQKLKPKTTQKPPKSHKQRAKPRSTVRSQTPRPSGRPGRPQKTASHPVQLDVKIRQLLKVKGSVTEAALRRQLGDLAPEVALSMPGVDHGKLSTGRFFYLVS